MSQLSIHLKLTCIAALSCLTLTNITAQDIPVMSDHNTQDSARTMAEVLPKAPYDWGKYLVKNLRYPKVARENNIQGKVFITFIVEKNGSISNVQATKGGELGGGIPEEAIRVVQSMPKWEPGMQNGVPVRCYFTVPINFRTQSEESKIYMPNQVETKPVPLFNIAAYLEKNIQYPKKAAKDKTAGTVYVICTITEKGVLENPFVFHKEAEEPQPKELEEEALRLVRSMPSWLPAKMQGKHVQCYTMIPVNFILPNK